MTAKGKSDWYIANELDSTVASVRTLRCKARKILQLPSMRGGWGISRKRLRGKLLLEARNKGISVECVAERFGIKKRSVIVMTCRERKRVRLAMEAVA